MDSSNLKSARLWIGLILIAFGVLFLLDNYHILYFKIPSILRHWEWILILFGVVLFATSRNKTGGVVLMAIGGIMLFGFSYVWPILLVLLGVYIIYRKNEPCCEPDKSGKVSSSARSKDNIDDVSIFGGGKKIISSNNFKGGKVTAIFGGSEIDLSGCKLAQGDNVVDVMALFGGSSFVVPEDWNVKLDIIPIFGGFSDNRRKGPGIDYQSDRSLTIKGFILFGGGEIKK